MRPARARPSRTFQPLAELRPYAIWNNVTARVIKGERMSLVVVDLEPDAVVPEHHHENEQLGFVLQGSLTFTIGGESRDLRAGDTYVIPSDVPHDVVVGHEGAVVVDSFAPVRADWDKLPRPDPFPPQWPG